MFTAVGVTWPPFPEVRPFVRLIEIGWVWFAAVSVLVVCHVDIPGKSVTLSPVVYWYNEA